MLTRLFATGVKRFLFSGYDDGGYAVTSQRRRLDRDQLAKSQKAASSRAASSPVGDANG